MYKDTTKHKDAHNYVPFDLDKQQKINRCIWANDETGKYCVYTTDVKGDLLFETDGLGRELTGRNKQLKRIIKKGKIQLVNIRRKAQNNG